ncbi:MAG: hydroxysqualene dehydroxylase HpnE [Xenophilus sp.]
MSPAPAKVAIVGGGWAGLACAVRAVQAGHAVTLFESARTPGGRARRVEADGGGVLDNGQHILIGAYRATLDLMRTVGVDPTQVLLRAPLALRFPDGGGLAIPAGPKPPMDLLAGIAGARGWSWRDRLSLLRTALRWRARRFACAPGQTVAGLCAGVRPRVMEELIAPLCVSALNVPVERASGAVFLRVLHDALFSEPGGADLLLPRADLGALLPEAAVRWLSSRGAAMRLGHRVQALRPDGGGWRVEGECFDRVVLAVPAWESARLARSAGLADAAAWVQAAEALAHEGIATVYVRGAPTWPGLPMLALRRGPAQFVFDRGRLGGPAGLAAFVVSACAGSRDELEARVLAQARDELGWAGAAAVQTIVEKRATFACTPALQRPGAQVAPALLACGDYVDGPYPATLEGAVRSALAAADRLG